MHPSLRNLKRRAERRYRRWRHPIRASEVSSVISSLTGETSELLLVHSSLSKCGQIEGGPDAVLGALAPACGTLVLPTHAYCYPDQPAGPAPVFDVRTSPSLVGAITSRCLELPGFVRSVHPTHALSARGPWAEELCAGHERCETPCGPGTPYTKLIERGAAALMFGCSMAVYTLFHTAEDAAGCDYLYEPVKYHLRARDANGLLHDVPMWRHDRSIRRRFAEVRPELEAAGLLRSARLGAGELLFLPDTGAVHEYVLERLRNDANYLLARELQPTYKGAACASRS